MSNSKSATLALIAAAAAATTATSARADIVTALAAAPVPAGNGLYSYTYNVQLTGGQLDATTGGATNPVPLQFGTVYDFGLIGGTGAIVSSTGFLASSFVFSYANTSTPTATQTIPKDNPALTNIRFTYDGSANIVITGQTTTVSPATAIADTASNLGTFTVLSNTGNFSTTAGGSYDGQSYKGANNTPEGNVGTVGTPVPEPTTLAALGAGLVGFAARRRR